MTVRDNSSNPNHSSARQTRMIVLVIGVLSLALVGGLISMIFFAADEVPVAAVGPVPAGPGAERGGVVFKGTVGLWEINGRQTADASRRVQHGTGGSVFNLGRIGSTDWRATGTLSVL